MLANKLIGALSQSEFDPVADTTVVVPIILSNASASFVFLIGTDAQIKGRVQLPIRYTDGMVTYHRYNNRLFIEIPLSSDVYVVNLYSFSIVSIYTGYPNNYRSYWSRFDVDKLITVRSDFNAYSILNMVTGTVTQTSYASTTSTYSSAGGRGCVTFYDKTSSGATSFGSRLYWQGFSGGSVGETSAATITSGALNPRSVVLASSPTNVSRGWSANGTSSVGMLSSHFGGPWKVLAGSNSATAWTLSSSSVLSSGNAYTWMKDGESPYGAKCLNSNLRSYEPFRWVDTTTNPNTYQFIVGSYDFSAASGTQTATEIVKLPASTDSSQLSTTICQVSSSGRVAILYQNTTSNNNTLTLAMVDNTTIAFSASITIDSIYSTVATFVSSSGNSDLGVYPA